MRYLLISLLLASCTTIHVNDHFVYKDSYRGPDTPTSKNSKGSYFIGARVLIVSNGFVQYKVQVYKTDSSILYDTKKDFRKYFKKQ